MGRTLSRAVGFVVGVAAVVGAWNLYQRVTTEQVPYTVVARVGDAELRRYPPAVLAETVAPSETAAFRRLFAYITGANEGETAVEMTTPVEVAGRGAEIPMTAPVEVSGRATPRTGDDDAADGNVRMAFYLPAEYDAAAAPEPTAEDVSLVAVPERTLAVRRFSWQPTERRIARETERLLADLERGAVPVAGDPFFMGYEGPGTLPFLRRNEVAVEVDATAA